MPKNVAQGNRPAPESPYASAAYALIERGLPAIPAMPDKKIPGRWERGHWFPASGWQQYADRLPTDAEVKQWSQWPGAGIALPLGGVSGLMAVDFDVEGEPLLALERELSGLLVCRKRGRKGFTAFMRVGATPWSAKCDLQSRFNITLPDAPVDRQSGRPASTRAVDVIAYGKQTIMPPSLHPEGMRYEWVTQLRLDDCSADDLPECPADLVERLTRALAPWTSADDRAVATRQNYVRNLATTDSWFRDLNDHALANLGLWVPQLIPEQFLQPGGDGGFRAVPYWRGVLDSAKVGISPGGIRDFATDQGYTPIDLVMAIRSFGVSDAVDWLVHAAQMPTQSVATEAFFSALRQWGGEAAPPARAVQSTAVSTDIGQPVATAMPVKQPSPTATEDNLPAEPVPVASPIKDAIGTLPACMAAAPGILGDIARYITASAFQPQPRLSLAAAISFCATVMGQIYCGPTGSRTNVYLLGVAESGDGKDHPLKSVKRMLAECQLDSFIGGNSMASGTAIYSRLAFQPNTAYMIDEIGMMLSRLNAANAGAHEREILDALMQAYSSADSPIFSGKDYADRGTRQTTAARYPCLNLLGVTTPRALFEAMSGRDVVSGFLNRFLLIEADPLPNPNLQRAPSDVPVEIIEWAKMIRNPPRAEDSPLRCALPEAPVMVGYANERVRSDAQALLLETYERRRAMRANGVMAEPMVARLCEHVGKIAIIAAAAVDPAHPVITGEIFDWATAFVQHQTARMLELVEERISEGPFDAKCRLVLTALKRAGVRGATKRDLCKASRKVRDWTERDWREVLASLQDRGDVLQIEGRWVLASAIPAAA